MLCFLLIKSKALSFTERLKICASLASPSPVRGSLSNSRDYLLHMEEKQNLLFSSFGVTLSWPHIGWSLLLTRDEQRVQGVDISQHKLPENEPLVPSGNGHFLLSQP